MPRGRKRSTIKWSATAGESPSNQYEAVIHGTLPKPLHWVWDYLEYARWWRQKPPTSAFERSGLTDVRYRLAEWLVDCFEQQNAKSLHELAKVLASRTPGKAADPLGLKLLELKGLTEGSSHIDESDEPQVQRPMGPTLAEMPIQDILNWLLRAGVEADATTVRKRMNALGIQRTRGRKREMRNS